MNSQQQIEALNRIVATTAEKARTWFDQHGEIPAVLYLLPPHKDDEPLVLPLDVANRPDVKILKGMATVAITLSHGFLLDVTNAEPFEGMPEEHPDAREAIVLLAETRSGLRSCAVLFILRPEHGRARLAPMKLLPADSVAIITDDSDSDTTSTRH